MGEHAAKVVDWLSKRDDIPHIETDITDVRAGLSELARQGVDILVVNGGDGTLQRVLTEIFTGGVFEQIPMIAPLRSGRTNMIALDIGSRYDTVRSLKTILNAVADGSWTRRTVERAVLSVELVGEHAPQYGMFCGFGVIHRAIELVHRLFPPGRAQGVFGSALVTATLVARAATGSDIEVLTADPMDIRLDEEPVPPQAYKLVLATTLDRFFLGMRPFWGTEKAPVRFTAIADGALGIPQACSVLRGRRPRMVDGDPRFVSHNLHKGELTLDAGITIDGELFAPRPRRVVRLGATQPVQFLRSNA